MSWDKTLLPASFRGVAFQIRAVDESNTRSVVVKEYPYRDGGVTVDLGRTARPLTFSVVIYGTDYENELIKLVAVLNEPGPGELIHPIFGPLQAQFRSYRLMHEAQRPDYCELQVEFTEHGIDVPLFNRSLPSQKIEATNQAIDAGLDPAMDQFEADLADLQAAGDDFALALLTDMLDALLALADLLADLDTTSTWQPRTEPPALDHPYLREPGAFSADLASGYLAVLTGLADTMANTMADTSASAGPASLASSWQIAQNTLLQPLLPPALALPTGPVSLPADRHRTPPVQPFVLAHLAVQQTVALASAAASVFKTELTARSMTPPAIETVAGDVRTHINSVIELLRATYPDLVRQRPLTEPLKALALHISDIAAESIRARPPLIERRIESTSSATLIAHFWYGDYRRADELLRLNPSIINPNFVPVGTVLLGYAQ